MEGEGRGVVEILAAAGARGTYTIVVVAYEADYGPLK